MGLASPEPAEALAASAAAEPMWEEWQRLRRTEGNIAGRRIFWHVDRPVLLVWRGTAERLAVVALGRRCLESQWLEPLLPMLGRFDTRLSLADSDGRAVSGRLPSGSETQSRASGFLGPASLDPSRRFGGRRSHGRVGRAAADCDRARHVAPAGAGRNLFYRPRGGARGGGGPAGIRFCRFGIPRIPHPDHRAAAAERTCSQADGWRATRTARSITALWPRKASACTGWSRAC